MRSLITVFVAGAAMLWLAHAAASEPTWSWTHDPFVGEYRHPGMSDAGSVTGRDTNSDAMVMFDCAEGMVQIGFAFYASEWPSSAGLRGPSEMAFSAIGRDTLVTTALRGGVGNAVQAVIRKDAEHLTRFLRSASSLVTVRDADGFSFEIDTTGLEDAIRPMRKCGGIN